MQRLDELLRCGICYDFMSTSMVTACSHNCKFSYLKYLVDLQSIDIFRAVLKAFCGH